MYSSYCNTLVYILVQVLVQLVIGIDKIIVIEKNGKTEPLLQSFKLRKNVVKFREVCFGTKCMLLIDESYTDLINSTFGEGSIVSISENVVFNTFQIDNNSTCKHQTLLSENLWYLNRINTQEKTGSYDSYTYTTHDDGEGVIAYVLDTGINTEHEQFENRASIGFIAAGIDNGNISDIAGHGTQVAGIIGSNLYGVAKSVEMVSVKVMNRNGAGLTMAIVEGLAYVYDQVRFYK